MYDLKVLGFAYPTSTNLSYILKYKILLILNQNLHAQKIASKILPKFIIYSYSYLRNTVNWFSELTLLSLILKENINSALIKNIKTKTTKDLHFRAKLRKW